MPTAPKIKAFKFVVFEPHTIEPAFTEYFRTKKQAENRKSKYEKRFKPLHEENYSIDEVRVSPKRLMKGNRAFPSSVKIEWIK